MLFDRAYSKIMESQDIDDSFELITPENYSHAIVVNHFRGYWELHEVEMVDNVYAGDEEEIPYLDNKGEYQGPMPPVGYVRANITTGRDIMDFLNISRNQDRFYPGCYYIIKYPEEDLKRLQEREFFNFLQAYLKPAVTAFDFTSKDTEDTFKDLTDAL